MGALIAAMSLVLLRLPVLLGGDAPTTTEKFLPFVPFILVIVLRFATPGRWRVDTSRALITALFLGLMVIAALRAIGMTTSFTPADAAIQIGRDLLLVLFGLAVFVRDSNEPRRQSAIRALCWAPAIYVAANVALYTIGIQPDRLSPEPIDQPAEMLGLIGIHHLRTFFPMGVGVNTFGITVGIAISISIILAVRSSGWRRTAAVAATAVSFYAILLTDSRGPLLAALAGAAAVLLFNRQSAAPSRNLGRFAYLVPFSPAIVIGALALLQNVAQQSNGIGRGSLATGSNRLYVWEPILQQFSSFNVEHLFGYGLFGQVTSGVSAKYAYLFADATYVPAAHNYVLQMMLDVGYLGLAVAIALFVVLVRGFADAARSGSMAADALLAGVVTLILVGFTEAAPTVYSLEAYLFFLLVVSAGVSRSLAPLPVAESARPRQVAGLSPAHRPLGAPVRAMR